MPTGEIFQMLRNNCSIYDPCSSYGYCYDDDEGQWACECKFWWEGALCDQQSSSGTQVIALGVILGFMMIVIFGIRLNRYLKKRRKTVTSKTQFKCKDIKINQTSSKELSKTRYPSHKLSRFLMGLSTVLLCFLTLSIKWILLKPIHISMTEKLHQRLPLFFQQHALCPIIELRKEFNIITFPIACLLIFMFAMMQKRNQSKTKRWFQVYGALPIPVDFFAHVKRTFSAVIFAIYADELLHIANELISDDDTPSDQGVILVYVLQITRVLIIGLRRYPILAAVYLNTVFTLLCATLYAWFDFAIAIFHSSLCQSDFYPTDKNFNNTEGQQLITKFNYYGTGMKLLYFQLGTDVPQYLCLAYISIKLPVLLYRRIRRPKETIDGLTREQEILLYSSLPHSTETQYVRNLFGIIVIGPSNHRYAWISRYIYRWRDDFRFSSRVLSVYASVFLLLFFITVQMILHGLPLLHELQQSLQAWIDFIISAIKPPRENSAQKTKSEFQLPDLIQVYLIAITITLTIIINQLFVMLVAIRRNLLQAFRGDDCEIPQRTPSDSIEQTGSSVHFAGYFIGYLLWGYMLVGVLAMIIALIGCSFIRFGSVRFVEYILKSAIPILLIIGFKGYLNDLLSQYVFLHQDGNTLSLKNRRLFMVFVYFNFFLDAFLGLISSITRIGRSIIGGILYMCRLDYATTGRKLETMDEGFSAYCGFIHMECAHRHPVMLFFASHLLRQYLGSSKNVSRARHKWHLVAFLLTNPMLIYRRKGYLARSHIAEKHLMLMDLKRSQTDCIEQPTHKINHHVNIISQVDMNDFMQQQQHF
ncbi:unnamed protein product [Rotaria socialis]|uniref:EGF-like domain-containing protein n=3 Tax=Rotaria socialis TaxID=392032 RepID=A0A820VB90_9BILA|nr:unnamed protein product [Rotaria socialis]CAF4497398.1 unnamed protein product [Rotaria socialis]